MNIHSCSDKAVQGTDYIHLKAIEKTNMIFFKSHVYLN